MKEVIAIVEVFLFLVLLFTFVILRDHLVIYWEFISGFIIGFMLCLLIGEIKKHVT